MKFDIERKKEKKKDEDDGAKKLKSVRSLEMLGPLFWFLRREAIPGSMLNENKV